MKLRYLFVLLTILLVVGCAKQAEIVEEEIVEETPTEEPKTVEVPTMEATVSEPEHMVLIKGPKAVEPSELTINIGETVVWKNDDYTDKDTGTGRAHTLAEWNDYFRSDRLEPGDYFSFTFAEAGTYEYRSITAPGAQGTITVE